MNQNSLASVFVINLKSFRSWSNRCLQHLLRFPSNKHVFGVESWFLQPFCSQLRLLTTYILSPALQNSKLMQTVDDLILPIPCVQLHGYRRNLSIFTSQRWDPELFSLVVKRLVSSTRMTGSFVVYPKE